MILTSIFKTGRNLQQICVLLSKLLLVCSSPSLKGYRTIAAALFLCTGAIISRNRRVMAIISHDREVWTQWRHKATLYVLFGMEFNHLYLLKNMGLSFKSISKCLVTNDVLPATSKSPHSRHKQRWHGISPKNSSRSK